jgi:hypothetical protein
VKAGIVPVSRAEMYLFLLQHVPDNPRMPEEAWPALLAKQLAGFAGMLGSIRERLGARSRINYRPLEMLMLPQPWHRGRANPDRGRRARDHAASGLRRRPRRRGRAGAVRAVAI